MKIESETYLDFSDVLIRPKRSTLSSRSQIDLNQNLKFLYSTQLWTGIPIIISNMDTTGTLEVYKEASKHSIITCLHKYHTISDFENYGISSLNPSLFMISTGISESDFSKLKEILNVVQCNWICMILLMGIRPI